MPISVSLSRPHGPGHEQAFDVVVPEPGKNGSRALVIGIHGGWWHQGHHHDLRGLCLALAEHGWASASVGHRLLAAPGAQPGPEHARGGVDIVHEIVTALPAVIEEAQLLGWNGSSVVLLGSGSGSLVALVAAHRLTLERSTTVRVRACIAAGVTPGLDQADGWAPALSAVIDRFAGRDRHALSPLQLTPHGFPDLLLLHGDKDVDIAAAAAQRLHQRISGANESSQIHILAGLGHHFVEHPASAGGRTALERILVFLNEHGLEVSGVEIVREITAEAGES